MKKSVNKLVFGLSAKEQIAERLRRHIEAHFETTTQAAASLNITKQRLFSYVNGKAMPRADLIDRISERWRLDLVGNGATLRRKLRSDAGVKNQLLLLFEKPVSFGDDDLKVVVQRKGNSLVASISLSANLRVG